MTDITGKKILMVIAPDRFRDEELFHTKEVLEGAGGAVTVVSKKTGTLKGMLGATFNVKKTLDEVNVNDYDALVFVGGGGAEVYFDDAKVHDMAKTAFDKKKLVCAICIAPSILANAGLLQGRKATVWKGDKYIRLLKSGGAEYTGNTVTRHGRIITANGPPASKKFGEKIVENLVG